MAKLATLASLLAALLVMSYAVAAHTTVTSIEIDEDAGNPTRKGCSGGSCSCREQIQTQGRGLNHCEQMFENMMSEGDRDNRGFGGETSCKQMKTCPHFRPCCQELRQLDTQCRCEGIRQTVMEQQRQYRGQGMQEEVVMCARKLPSMCGMSPQYCQMRAIWY